LAPVAGTELARFGASQTSLDVRAADATPGRGTFWILKIAHAPSPKNLPKNGFCPRKGGSLSVEGVFAKKFSGVGEDSAISGTD
jgi:hypothetical protein